MKYSHSMMCVTNKQRIKKKLTVRIIIEYQLHPSSHICSNIQGEEEDDGHCDGDVHEPHDE